MPDTDTYTVNRAQDGAEVRAWLTLDLARSECAMLNARAAVQVRAMGATPVYASMHRGEISRYEVRSADGMVIA